MFPIIPAGTAAASGNSGIMGFGWSPTSSYTGVTNIVSNAGVIADDVAAVGTARGYPAGCEYGTDTGLFWGGYKSSDPQPGALVATLNLVSNLGVVASDAAATTGTGRNGCGGCDYGGDKGIVGFGWAGVPIGNVGTTNLISNAGVVASDVSAVGNVRTSVKATEFGGDKGIFIGGYDGGAYDPETNIVSNVGVVASDVAGVGTLRYGAPGCRYGTDTAIYAFGYANVPVNLKQVAISNLISNTGVVADDQAAVTGTPRSNLGACEYGDDKGIFAYGASADPTTYLSVSNKVSNTGVVATDVTGVGTGRYQAAGCAWGS